MHVSFRRYSPLSLEIVEKRTNVFGPKFLGRKDSKICKDKLPNISVQKFAHVIASETATTVQILVKIGAVKTSHQISEV